MKDIRIGNVAIPRWWNFKDETLLSTLVFWDSVFCEFYNWVSLSLTRNNFSQKPGSQCIHFAITIKRSIKIKHQIHLRFVSTYSAARQHPINVITIQTHKETCVIIVWFKKNIFSLKYKNPSWFYQWPLEIANCCYMLRSSFISLTSCRDFIKGGRFSKWGVCSACFINAKNYKVH